MISRTLLKKTLLGCLTVAASCFFTIEAYAQASAYTFSQSAGTYSAVTGTTIAQATGTTPSSASLDDNSYAVTLPFTFNFAGTGFTAVNVSTNGSISFGTNTTVAYTAINDNTSGGGVVAAFNTDLRGIYATTASTTNGSNILTSVANIGNIAVGQTITGTGIPASTTITSIGTNTITLSANATSTGTPTITVLSGNIITSVSGSAPNRVFTIQWTGFQAYATSNTSFNFQIKLSEGGGLAPTQLVTIVYGTSLSTSSSSVQVGLRGNTSNSDFNDRNGTTSWTGTTAGTSNLSAVSYSSTNTPPPGLTFIYTPPNPCTGTPTAGTVAATTGLACSNAPFQITYTGGTSGVSGLTYQVQSSPAGANTFSTIGTSLPYTVTSQTAATDYKVIVTCTNSTFTGTSNTITVGQNTAANCPCIPVYTTACAFSDNIDTFRLTGSQFTYINDLGTGCVTSASPGYDNRSAQTPVKLAQGTLHTGTISSSYGSSESAKIWIDFNDNGIFESADSVGIVSNVPNVQSFFGIQIPATAPLGNHRMRVRLVYNTTVGTIDPCASYTYGETHDYTVTIVSCPAPTVNLGPDAFICPGTTATLNAGNPNSTYLYSNGVSNQTNTVTAAGTYRVVVTTVAGCIGRDTIVLTTGTIPTVNLGADTVLCNGASLTLDAGNAGSSYLYSNFATTQTITVTNAASYNVRVTNAQGCIGRDTIVVTTGTNPTVNLGNDTVLCNSASLTLNAGNAGSTYLYSNAATTQTTSVSAAGTYNVRVTNTAGCIGRDTIVITTGTRPIVNLGNDTVLCNGASLILDAGNPGSTYLYSNAATTQTAAVTAAASYNVRVTNAAGCVGRDTIVITTGTRPIVNLGNDTTLCPGSVITLNAGNAGSTYLFSNNATTQTTGVTAIGTYNVRVTNAQGCIGRDTIVINPATNPVVNLGNDTAICPGATITLNAGNTGSTYLFSNNATTQSISVTSGGTYSVRVTNAAKCIGRDTIVITQGVNPVVNLGPDTTLCPFALITLDAGNPGGTYLFSNNTTTQTIQAASAGTFSVRVTNAQGCIGRDTINIAAGLYPVVNLGNDTTICEGNGLTLNAGNPGSRYLYSNTATTQTTVVSTAGLYYVFVKNAGGCSATDSITISTTPRPTVSNITPAKTGASVAFTSDATNATGYLWSFGDGGGATTQSPTHVYTTNGTFTVTVVTVNSCGYDTATTTVVIAGVGVGSTPALGTELNMYPNPANSFINLDYKSTSVHMKSLIIINSVGATVLSKEGLNGNKETIDISTLPAGSYMVRISTDQGAILRRLQIVK